jgi:hypothetical protein
MIRKNLSVGILIFFMLSLFSFSAGLCTPAFAQDEDLPELDFSGKKMYTAYNIWYEAGKETALWCINYKTGIIIPAGTEVTEIALTNAVAGRKSGAETMAISFVTVEDQQKYWVNITEKFHPGKTIGDYAKLMFSEKNFDQLTEGMTETEIEGIKEGVVKIGMSKEAVLVSYGYPPEHKTPSLERDTWYYWTNRFRSKAINFDEDGKACKKKKDPDAL